MLAILQLSSMRMLVLIILLFTPGLLAITFENNGYKDVIVTIHPDVPEVNGQNIINNIKVCTCITVKSLITIQHKIIILGVTTAHYLSFLDFSTSSCTYFSIKNSLFACVCSRKFRIIERIRKTCHIIIFQTLFSGL